MFRKVYWSGITTAISILKKKNVNTVPKQYYLQKSIHKVGDAYNVGAGSSRTSFYSNVTSYGPVAPFNHNNLCLKYIIKIVAAFSHQNKNNREIETVPFSSKSWRVYKYIHNFGRNMYPPLHSRGKKTVETLAFHRRLQRRRSRCNRLGKALSTVFWKTRKIIHIEYLAK